MKKPVAFLTALVFLFFTIGVEAATVKLRWDPNTESDLAGYKLYYWTDAGPNGTGATEGISPIDVGNVTIATVTLPAFPADGMPRYFAVTAYSTSSIESSFSNVVLIYPGDNNIPILIGDAQP